MSNMDPNTEEAIISRMEIQRGLGRVEGKLDQIISGMSSHEADDKYRFEEVHKELHGLDNRTSGLERKIYYANGIAAAVVLFITYFPFKSFWH